MKQRSFNQLQDLFADTQGNYADNGVVVLTPTLRLARFLHSRYAHYKSSQGLRAWAYYPCWSLTTWIQTLWEQWSLSSQSPEHLLLNKTQELAIWQEIIQKSEIAEDLFNPTATANVARQASQHLSQWRCEASRINNHQPMGAWYQSYLQLCDQQQLVDSSQVIELLIQGITQGQIPLPSRLILVGFDTVTPLIQTLLNSIGKTVDIEQIDILLNNTNTTRYTLETPEAEIKAAAYWAADLVTKQPGTTVGIVIPQLASQFGLVERIFSDVFEPQLRLPQQTRHAHGFNISAAIPLNSAPPIMTALAVLKLNHHQQETAKLSPLLLSPFIGDQDELPSRALLDEHLRENFIQLNLNELRAVVAEFSTETDSSSTLTPDLYKRLNNWHELTLDRTKTLYPSQWAERFSQQLVIMAWPGMRKLDTLEFQQINTWQQCLEKLASFDATCTKIPFERAYQLLELICTHSEFQAQTGDSPVQILGLFEAAGLIFDHLWVMHLDSESWPAPLSPNGLLPLSLQKSLQMPMASQEKELLLAKQLTQRLNQSAKQIIMSHALRDGDKLLRCSPLIAHFPIAHSDCPLKIDPYWQSIHQHAELESIADACGPRLDQSKTVKGGTQILKDQAACPFRAFAIHRLGAKAREEMKPGISAAQRGLLVHNALERIWKVLQNQANLLASDDDNLSALIDRCVTSSLQHLPGHLRLGEQLKRLESQRLQLLLRAWLELEKSRAPFTVKLNESSTHLKLAELPLNIRYDRIDRLEDGSLFVIDYKTSSSTPQSWAGNRPDEPQVPLYSIANQQTVSGAAFGQINADQVAFKGISANSNCAPDLLSPDQLNRVDLPDNWPGILDHWRQSLENLAKEFIAGSAEVKPKHKSLNCRYCHLHSLCRIKEHIELVEEDELSSGANNEKMA